MSEEVATLPSGVRLAYDTCGDPAGEPLLLVMGLGGPLYGVVSVLAGAAMLWFAIQVYSVREGEAAAVAAKNLFGYSILYLMVLYAVLLAEHALGIGF